MAVPGTSTPCDSPPVIGRGGEEVVEGDAHQGGRELRDPILLTDEKAQREFLALVEGIVSDFTPHPEEPKVGVPRRLTSLSRSRRP